MRYEAARRPVMDYVAKLSHHLALLFTATSTGVQVVRPWLLRRNRGNVPLRRRIVSGVAGFQSEPATVWSLLSALGLARGRTGAVTGRAPEPRPLAGALGLGGLSVDSLPGPT